LPLCPDLGHSQTCSGTLRQFSPCLKAPCYTRLGNQRPRQPSIFGDTWGDGAGILFGRLDNEPLLGRGLQLGDEIAVGYRKVVEHRKAREFQKQEGTVALGSILCWVGPRIRYHPT
jgi:hypothetical protein